VATSGRRSISERIPPIHELPSLLNWVLARSEEDKCEADLRMHFDDEYLKREFVSGATIKDFWKSVYMSERAEQQQQAQQWSGFCGQLSALSNFVIPDSGLVVLREKLKAPILVMSGTKDRIIHPDSGKRLHGYILKGASAARSASVKLVMLEAGHFLPIQKRREVAAGLLELWETACPSGKGQQEILSKGAGVQRRLMNAAIARFKTVAKMPVVLSHLANKVQRLGKRATAGSASGNVHGLVETSGNAAEQSRWWYGRGGGKDKDKGGAEGEESVGFEEEEDVAAELLSRFGETDGLMPSSMEMDCEKGMGEGEEGEGRRLANEALRRIALSGDWGPYQAVDNESSGQSGDEPQDGQDSNAQKVAQEIDVDGCQGDQHQANIASGVCEDGAGKGGGGVVRMGIPVHANHRLPSYHSLWYSSYDVKDTDPFHLPQSSCHGYSPWYF
jgi:hypothetical protein